MIHTFKEDFYGEILSVVMVGYIRPERSYDSLGKCLSFLITDTSLSSSLHRSHTLAVSSLFLIEALITAINNDIEEAKFKLSLPEHLKLREDNFFTSAPNSSSAVPPTTASTSQTIMNGH